MSDVGDREGSSAATHKSGVNVDVPLLPHCVEYNQCYVKSPMEEMEIVLVIVLAQHNTQTGANRNQMLRALAL